MKKYFIIISLLSSLVYAGLIKPDNGQTLNYIHILFEWEQLPNVIGYNIQASEQFNFNSLILDRDEVSTVYVDESNFDWNDN